MARHVKSALLMEAKFWIGQASAYFGGVTENGKPLPIKCLIGVQALNMNKTQAR